MPCLLAIALMVTQTVAAVVPPRPMEVQARRYHNAAIRRGVGWGLTGLGLATMTAGAVVAGFGATEVNTSGTGYNRALTYVIAGGSVAAASFALIIPGLILALQGQGAMTDAEWRMRALKSAAYVAPTPSGFMLGARGTF